jgi:hypothetical protein
MNKEEWDEIKVVFNAALNVPVSERRAFLERLALVSHLFSRK